MTLLPFHTASCNTQSEVNAVVILLCDLIYIHDVLYAGGWRRRR